MEKLLEQILLLKEVLSLIETSDDEHEEESESESESELDNELELVYDSELDDIDDGCYRKRKWRRT
jgi:hypothetical protein